MRYLTIILLALTFTVTKAQVTNYTNEKWATQYIEKGLKALDIKDIKLIVVSMPSHLSDTEAYISYEPRTDTYNLFLKEDQRKSYTKRQLSHEIIHIHQYHTNKLTKNNNVIIYDGVKYSLKNTSYKERPWEIHAQRDEMKLRRKIKSM